MERDAHNNQRPPLDRAEDDRTQPGAASRPEPMFNLPFVVIAAIFLCTGVHLIRIYLLTIDQDIELILRAAFIPVRYSGEYAIDLYAFTSTVTYAFLHGGWAHLVINMIWLAAFGAPLANRLGAPRFILFWLATAWGAIVLHYVLHMMSGVPLVGASGAISGMMGAAARFGFQIDRRAGRGSFRGAPLTIGQTFASRTVLAFLGIWMAVNLISGFGVLVPEGSGTIAWEAHIGGFLVGFFGIGLFAGRDPRA